MWKNDLFKYWFFSKSNDIVVIMVNVECYLRYIFLVFRDGWKSGDSFLMYGNRREKYFVVKISFIVLGGFMNFFRFYKRYEFFF